MVDSNLIEEIKEIRKKGISKPSDGFKICEFVKQMTEKSEEMYGELEDGYEIAVQFVITDADYKYWLEMGARWIDCGEGMVNYPSATVSLTSAMWSKIFSSEIDLPDWKLPPHDKFVEVYMSDNLVVDGDMQQALAYVDLQPFFAFLVSKSLDDFFKD